METAYIDEPHLWEIVVLSVDNALFVLYFIAISYLFVFSIGSVMRKPKVYGQGKKRHRYLVLFFVSDRRIDPSAAVEAFMAQDYPAELYDILLVTPTEYDPMTEAMVERGVGLIDTTRDKCNKSESLKYAMGELHGNEYDMVVLMDCDSVVDSDFMTNINNARCGGMKAMQAHLVAGDTMHSDMALFGAVSQEINNSIFRRGHVNMGLSSALCGSAMVFDSGWLTKNAAKLVGDNIETQLETMLLEQRVFIEYLDYVHVKVDKAQKASEFYEQRDTWLSDNAKKMGAIVRKFPGALLSGNFDYCDKLWQWLLPSRIILVGTLVMISLMLLVVWWAMALKWLALLLMLVVAFSIALPDQFIDARFVKALRSAPLLFTLTVVNAVLHKLKLKKPKATNVDTLPNGVE